MNSIHKKLKTRESLQELGNKMYSYECLTHSYILCQPEYRDVQSQRIRCYLYQFCKAPSFGILFCFEIYPLPYKSFVLCRDSQLLLTDSELNACKEFQGVLWKDMFMLKAGNLDKEALTNYMIVPILHANIDFEVIKKALHPNEMSIYESGRYKDRGIVVQGLYSKHAVWYLLDYIDTDLMTSRDFLYNLLGKDHPRLEELLTHYKDKEYGVLDIIFDTTLDLKSLVGFRKLFEDHIKQSEEPYILSLVKPIKSARSHKHSSSTHSEYTHGIPIIHPSLLREFYLDSVQIDEMKTICSMLYKIEEFSYFIELARRYDYHGDFYILRSACIAPSLNSVHNYEALENLGDTVLKAITSLHCFVANNQDRENRLTHVRTAVVKNTNLVKISISQGLYRFLKTARHKYSKVRPAFFQLKADCFQNSITHVFSEKMLADHVESLIGSFYIADGIKGAALFIDKLGIMKDDEKWNVTLNSLNYERVDILTSATYLSGEFTTDQLFPIPHLFDTGDLISQISQLQLTFNYQFKDLHLLQEALTHKSIDPKNNYERMEYLGDAILDLIILGNIYPMRDNFTAEELTIMKHTLVNNNVFAKCAVSLELYRYFRCEISIREIIDEYLCNIDWREDILEFGVYNEDPPKHLNDIFEAVIGAIFLDSKSLQETSKIVISILYQPILYLVSCKEKLQQNIMSKLTNLCTVLKKTINFNKTQNGQAWTVKILDENQKLIAEATCTSEKLAKNKAAFQAYKLLANEFSSK